MNLYGWITDNKAVVPDVSWHTLNTMLQSATSKPDDYRAFKSGEALRSWYRRQKSKRSEITNPFDALVKSLSAMGNALGHGISSGISSGYAIPDTTSYSPIPESMPSAFEAPLQLQAIPTLVLADLHVPYHDHVFIRGILERYSPQQIIIAGDLFDFDSLSRHSKAHHVQSLETELELAGSLLQYLAQYAPLYICSGNHDERLSVKLDSIVTFKRLISAALNGRTTEHPITVTDRDFMLVGESYIVGHLDKYSLTPGKLAYGIAQKHKRHALVGHDHLVGVYGNSQYMGASIGMCASADRFWYSERRLTTMPVMQQGYAFIVDDDTFELMNAEHKVYFRRYLGDHAINEFAVM